METTANSPTSIPSFAAFVQDRKYLKNVSPKTLHGSRTGWIAVALVNNTGQTINQASVHYDGEQWRDQNSTAQTMVLEYGIGNSFITSGILDRARCGF